MEKTACKKSMKSQEAYILRILKRGKKITPLDALRSCGCFRLSARIHDLKNEGHPIVRSLFRTRDGKVVAQYGLVK